MMKKVRIAVVHTQGNSFAEDGLLKLSGDFKLDPITGVPFIHLTVSEINHLIDDMNLALRTAKNMK